MPELLTQKRRVFDLRPWFRHLQDDLASGREVTQAGFRLVPAFDFRRTGTYQERFWSLFIGGPADLPRHFPYRFRLPRRDIRPLNDTAVPGRYAARLRGFLFPYGAMCLRMTEYVEPTKPCNANDLVGFLEERVRVDGRTMSRNGILGELKDQVTKAFVSLNPQVDHSAQWYRILHVDSTRKLAMKKDWKELAPLLAFSREPARIRKYRPGDYPNLSMDPKKQILLFSPYAGVLVTPDLWEPARVRGRRCLRNRVAEVAELALIQHQMYFAYRTAVETLRSDLPLTKERPLSAISEAIRPKLPFDIIRDLHAILTAHKLLQTHEPDRTQWNLWLDTMTHQLFADRDAAAKAVEALNEVCVQIDKKASTSVAAAIDTFSKLPLPKPS